MFNLLSCCRKSFLEVYLYPPTPDKSTYHSISDDHLCLLITQLLIIQSIKSTHEYSFELLHTLKPIWRKIQFWSYHQLNKQKIQYLNLTKKTHRIKESRTYSSDETPISNRSPKVSCFWTNGTVQECSERSHVWPNPASNSTQAVKNFKKVNNPSLITIKILQRMTKIQYPIA